MIASLIHAVKSTVKGSCRGYKQGAHVDVAGEVMLVTYFLGHRLENLVEQLTMNDKRGPPQQLILPLMLFPLLKSRRGILL